MTPPSRPDAAWRRANLGHLLFAATGRCVACKLRVVHDAGYDTLTDAQLALFESLDGGGARLTDLAARAGMTKTSMIELVDKAERLGFVARRPDPADRRAKIVGLTPRGRRLRRVVKRGMAAAEDAFVAAVGQDNLAAVREGLSVLAPDAATAGVERMLSDAARRFVADVLSEVHRHGRHDVTEALLALFRTLELEGSRLTDIAAAARITKQSMRDLVERAEGLGLVERAPDPRDGRAKMIRFSEAGLVMLEDMRRGVEKAETRFSDAAGEAALVEIKRLLGAYLSAS